MYMLESSYVQSQIKNKTRAVGVPKLALERIKTIKIPVCSIDIQKFIVENIKKDLNTIKDNQRLLVKNQDIIDNKLNLIWSE
jgi:restriction endonuclease S subunit